jgi:ribosome-associated toxin RatA of RatAB toxin-antitoxin module
MRHTSAIMGWVRALPLVRQSRAQPRRTTTTRGERFPAECFDALLDVDNLPAWQRALRSAAVLKRDADDRPAVVEFVVDARVRTVRYRIRQTYLQQPRRIATEYLGGDFRDFGGEWRFEALPDGRTCGARSTHRPWRLRARPGPLGPRRRRVMRSALQDLKAHLERPA